MKHKLCYIDGYFAYFTTQDLDKQWGDDWNDAPYEYNAGRPYSYRKNHKEEDETPWEIIHVAFSAPLETPADKARGKSRYSVEQINTGAVAWLASDEWTEEKITIMAGVTLLEFIDKIGKSGGDVYLTESLWRRLKPSEHEDGLGKLADKVDNYLAATNLPMSAEFHLGRLKAGLREISNELKTLYKEITGESPWHENEER